MYDGSVVVIVRRLSLSSMDICGEMFLACSLLLICFCHAGSTGKEDVSPSAVWVILRQGSDVSSPVKISALKGDFDADSLLEAAKVKFRNRLSDVDVSDMRLYTDVSLAKQFSPNDLVFGGTFDNPLCITTTGAAPQHDFCVRCWDVLVCFWHPLVNVQGFVLPHTFEKA